MRTREYEKFVVDFWTSRRAEEEQNDLRQKFIMTVGLGGECGEVLELLKKEVRDGVLDKMELSLELGDVLYYIVKIAKSNGLTLNDLMVRNKTKLELRRKYGKQKIESGWLIESKSIINNQLMWLKSCDEIPNWTIESSAGLRFSRKEDAELMASSLPIQHRNYIITEHQWG